jgi:actin-related protein
VWGKEAAIVVDMGSQTIECVPIWEGYEISKAMIKVNYGGEH